MSKAVLTQTKEEAASLIASLDRLLGYPNPDTGTVSWTTPRLNATKTKWIVLMPAPQCADALFMSLLVSDYGTLVDVVDVDPDADFYKPTYEEAVGLVPIVMA